MEVEYPEIRGAWSRGRGSIRGWLARAPEGYQRAPGARGERAQTAEGRVLAILIGRWSVHCGRFLPRMTLAPAPHSACIRAILSSSGPLIEWRPADGARGVN